MSVRPERDQQQAAQCVYSTPCECGRSYIGETGRPLALRLREYRNNLKGVLIKKSKLAQHNFEEGNRAVWDEASILEIGTDNIHRKRKESGSPF
jgi:hypothetical protein